MKIPTEFENGAALQAVMLVALGLLEGALL
jgi:hypothetical protein